MLANSNEPLVLQDGTRIDPSTGAVIRDRPNRFVAVPTNREAVKQITSARRRLADLPAPPKTMNTVSVVFMYTTFGLSDQDIALAMNLTVDQVLRIKANDVYATVSKQFIKEIADADTTEVRDLLVLNSRSAAQRMLELADSEDEKVAQKAAADILDRAGLRPADVHEHRVKMEGGLTIEFIKKETNNNVIDGVAVEMEEVSDDVS